MKRVLVFITLVLFTVGCGTMTILKEPSFTDANNQTYRYVNVHTTNTNVIAPSTDTTRGYLCVSQPDDQAVEIVVHGEDAGDIGKCNPIDKIEHVHGRGFVGATGSYAIAGGFAYGLSNSGDDTNLNNNSGSSAFSGANARSSSSSRATARSGGMRRRMD